MRALPGETNLLLRWASFVTGDTFEKDYHLTDSEGVAPPLHSEIKDICVAFHPHNEIRQFPSGRPVFLFWRAKSTGDYIITRVSSRATDSGERRTLESYSLILTSADLEAVGTDPFAVRDLALHDSVSQTASLGSRDLLAAAVVPPPSRHSEVGGGEAPDDTSWERYAEGGEWPRSDEALNLLETYCRNTAAEGRIPRSFTTWWESNKSVPADYFDIVLRVVAPRGFTMREAEENATLLTEDIRVSLPRESGDAERIRQEAATFLASLMGVLRSLNDLTPEQFAQAMAQASTAVKVIGSDLNVLQRTAAAEEQAAPDFPERDLETLSLRCRQLSDDLLRLRHPNPFAADLNNPTVTPQKRRWPARKTIFLISLVLVAVAAAALFYAGLAGPRPPSRPVF